MTNLRQSKEFARFMKLSGWIVEKAGDCYVYIRKIPLFPPLIMKIQYPTPPIPFVQIEKLAQKYRPLKIQIQPLKIEPGFKKYSYKPSKEAGHVTKTIQIDLTQSKEKILKQMKKDARYGIRRTVEKQIEVKTLRRVAPTLRRGLSRSGGRKKSTSENQELELFRQAWRNSVGWQRYVPSLKTLQNLKKAFGQNALFLIVKSAKNTSDGGVETSTTPRRWRKKDKIHGLIAGAVILIAGKTVYYYYAFTSKEGRENFAQYLLVWKAIKLAKKQGCKIFDFEGIYDKRFPIKSWKGFSHFKKSFGGEEIEYPKCWVKYNLPYFHS